MVVIYSMEDEETIPCLSSDSVSWLLVALQVHTTFLHPFLHPVFFLHLIFFEAILGFFFCGTEESEVICM